MVTHVLEAAALFGAFGACVYYCLTAFAAAAFVKLPDSGRDLGPATIIIPLKGSSASLENELRAFCALDYPRYQLIFALENGEDPAMGTARSVKSAFSARDIEIATWDRASFLNPKENSHQAALRVAKHELIVLADGDVLAGPDYLAKVLAPLADPKVGLASFPYRFIGAGSLWQRLKALTIHAGFLPSVLVARLLAPVRFGIGATMVLRRAALDAAGGLAAAGDFLASDYHLAQAIAAAGWRVELGRHWLDIRLEPLDAQAFARWQLRWTRTMRFTTPAGYAGLIATQGLPWAFLFLILTRGGSGFLVFALTLFIRWLCLWLVWEACGVRDSLALVPLYDAAAFLFWTAGWLGRGVWWGGRRFELEAGTRIR